MNSEYISYQDKKLEEFEALCRRCGACCGALDNDSCQHLLLGKDGKYSCNIYENRFGLHKTKSGREFICVPIRQILFKSWSGSWNCAYKKTLSRHS
jgi:hypothetical protein